MNRPDDESDFEIQITFVYFLLVMVLSAGVTELYLDLDWDLTMPIVAAGYIAVVQFRLIRRERDLKELYNQLREHVCTGSIAKIRSMLQDGLNPNVTGFNRRSLVELATEQNHPEVVELLLRNGGNVDPVRRSKPETSALIIAAQNGNTEIIRSLVEYGANVNLVDKHNRSPLIWACVSGAPRELIEILLRNGADPSIRDSNGYTALDFAEELGL